MKHSKFYISTMVAILCIASITLTSNATAGSSIDGVWAGNQSERGRGGAVVLMKISSNDEGVTTFQLDAIGKTGNKISSTSTLMEEKGPGGQLIFFDKKTKRMDICVHLSDEKNGDRLICQYGFGNITWGSMYVKKEKKTKT